MNPESLSVLTGSLVSVAFNTIPGLRVWFAARSSEAKQLFMLAASAIAALGSTLYPCLGSNCSIDWKELALSFILTAVSTQGIDRITPKPKDVERVKSRRKKGLG